MRKLPEGKYKKLASRRNGYYLGPYPGSVDKKTWWGCNDCGYEWENTYYWQSKNKHWCPECSQQRVKEESDYHRLARESGGKWIGESLPQATIKKTKWKCNECNYTWEVSYNSISSKETWCPNCANIAPKTKEDYHALAKEKDKKWIDSKLPERVIYDTKWQCNKCGYIWETSYNNIMYAQCKSCSNQIPKNINDYISLAEEMGGEFIGDIPKNTNEKALWRCENNHEFKREYQKISVRGSWCFKCSNSVNGQPVSSPQLAVNRIVGGELNFPIGNYSIDIFLDGIAIEYDGWYWHKDKLDSDKEKTESLIDSGYSVLRIKAGTKIPDKKRIYEALNKLRDGHGYEEIVLQEWKDNIGE